MRNDGTLEELKQTLSRVLAKLDRAVSSHAARIARRPVVERALRRRRIALVAVGCRAGARASRRVVTGAGPLGEAVREITLPLRHEDIIRQQAADKNLDPALIAAVIYEESKFRDQTSHAGARGLMQITPETADFIARRSGGIRFEQGDLATPADQHLLRHLVPALPDRPLRAATRRSRSPPTTRAGQRRPLGRARGRARELRQRAPHPVPGDARLREERAGASRPVPRPLRERARALASRWRARAIAYRLAQPCPRDSHTLAAAFWPAPVAPPQPRFSRDRPRSPRVRTSGPACAAASSPRACCPATPRPTAPQSGRA